MPWLTLGASITGTSHLARATPCQDAFRVLTFGAQREWLAISVADGAGSASLSQFGAMTVCDFFVHRVQTIPETELLNRDAIIALFAEGRGQLLEEAVRLDAPPRELACTAMLAVIGPAGAVFAQLGDGAIVYIHEGTYHVAFWPEPGEYANVTDFLTDEAYADHLQVRVFPAPPLEIALLTDGLQRLGLDFSARSPYEGFFLPLFRDLRQADDQHSLYSPLRSFLESDRVNQRTDDDKTLVLAVRQ